MDECVYKLFEDLKIPYELIEHRALHKASDNEKYNIDFKGVVCCKNLFVKDSKTEEKYLVSLAIDKKADLKFLKEELKSNRLTFANEDELYQNLGVKSGSASILNITLKPDTKVVFLVDKQIFEFDKVCFHPNINTKSICFSPKYLIDILDYYDAKYLLLDV